MDWSNPMALFGLAEEPQSLENVVGDDNQDDDEDLYGQQPQQQQNQMEAQMETQDARPGASEVAAKVAEAVPNPPALILSAQQKAENERKAQLLREKLLAKRQNTPSRPASNVAQVTPTPKETKIEHHDPVKDVNGIETLLDTGKALADARSLVELTEPASTTQTNGIGSQLNGHPKQPAPQPAKLPTDLSDEYYTDLAAWLEMTGYHDADFRESKLSTYKERLALEQEAALIAEKLEKIRQREQEATQSFRMMTPASRTVSMPAPPLPKVMPTLATNGLKRGRSPEPFASEKARRQDNGEYRIRGANDSPTDTRAGARRMSRSPPILERRITHPDARRRSIDDRSRDSSLERRQSYYRRDGEGPSPRINDHYAPGPRDALPPRPYAGPGRNNSYTRTPQHRGVSGPDLFKGGQSHLRNRPK